MRLKYCITSILLLSMFHLNAQTDTTAFAYQKPLFDFTYDKPVFKLQNEQLTNKNRFLRFSVLTGHREGVKPIQGMTNFNGLPDQITGTRRIMMFNLSIADMLTHGFIKSNHLILEVKDPSKYQFDPKYGSKESWERKNTWCYEYSMPIAILQNDKPDRTVNGGFMGFQWEKDLADKLGVSARLQKRQVKCLVLVRTSATDKIKSAGGTQLNGEQNGLFQNTVLAWLGPQLDAVNMPPFVDETKYEGPVDLNLQITNWKDLPALRKALQRYDLDLKEEWREEEVFIITELNYNEK